MIIKKTFVLVLALFTIELFALECKVADIFSDHMVLQRDKAVPVWGRANPGERVSVEFKGQKFTATAYKDGKWLIKLKAIKADPKPAAMTISYSGGRKVIKDILVGEVWLCSGQSNMEWPVSRSKQGKKMIAEAEKPMIRLFKISGAASGYPLNSVNAEWRVCSPRTVPSFSAVGYYFALELFKELKIPVGMIQSTWGGTRIEPWTPPAGFATVSMTKPILNQIASANKAYQSGLKKNLPHLKEWVEQAEKDSADGKNIKAPKAFPVHELNSRYAPTGLYNAMIAPLVPFAVRGVIWYQGEANIADGMGYFFKMKALINGWRKVWRERDFPFYFVQIAPYRYGGRKLSALWEGQYRAAKEIKNCGLVFPGDVGNINDIHPRRKYPVGKRLALLALANDYGKKIIDGRSPSYKNLKADGNELVISFDNVESGFKTNDGKVPAEFKIAGEDEKYYPAKAEIKGKSIILSSEKVKKPVAAQYAWHNLAVPNVVNTAGLPLLPFATSEKKSNLALNKTYVSSDRNPWGWDDGLTDGSWGVSNASCFATKNSPAFPKYVTVDLGKAEKISKVKLGVPHFGSTKTVEIETGIAGKAFKKVGSVAFEQKKVQNKVVSFPSVEARYLRLKFINYHPEKVHYDQRFMFITELEVY